MAVVQQQQLLHLHSWFQRSNLNATGVERLTATAVLSMFGAQNAKKECIRFFIHTRHHQTDPDGVLIPT